MHVFPETSYQTTAITNHHVEMYSWKKIHTRYDTSFVPVTITKVIMINGLFVNNQFFTNLIKKGANHNQTYTCETSFPLLSFLHESPGKSIR